MSGPGPFAQLRQRHHLAAQAAAAAAGRRYQPDSAAFAIVGPAGIGPAACRVSGGRSDRAELRANTTTAVGTGGRDRTCGLLGVNEALFLAELHPL